MEGVREPDMFELCGGGHTPAVLRHGLLDLDAREDQTLKRGYVTLVELGRAEESRLTFLD